ncbi:hypothetical protein RFI_18139 [Reticulomyxa filosa]|uniref:Caspase family p20 domain-containing protein n=1 Tax=Reticulomyxa filosa TaxID=46433 RepID=X6MZL7_RETFI|nr:hypothetical protein RFI_18139 [Reticulomyxa filosa]|eukprot:ETO19098.1 hypothetical protein RFI_18139 [Reticulomyxa filosa]
MSSKAIVTIGSKKYRLNLTNLTVTGLKEQIIEVSKSEQRGNTLIKVTDADGFDIATNQHLRRLVKDGRLLFFAEFQPKSTKKKDVKEKKEITAPLASPLASPLTSSLLSPSPSPLSLSSNEMKNPLVLLAGAIKYKKMAYLQNVKNDLILLQKLFKEKFGYQVFNTFNLQNISTESLTLNDLNKFILKYVLNLNDNTNNKSYDGLIFVWCGYGNNEDIIITSDEKKKSFQDIQEDIITKTDYFIGKPKIFIKIEFIYQQNISSSNRIKNTKEIKYDDNKIRYNQDVDIFNIYANISKKPIVI